MAIMKLKFDKTVGLSSTCMWLGGRHYIYVRGTEKVDEHTVTHVKFRNKDKTAGTLTMLGKFNSERKAKTFARRQAAVLQEKHKLGDFAT